MNNWIPTQDEIDYFKRLARDPNGDDEYYEMMLPLLLEWVNAETCQNFTHDDLPATVKLFLAQAVKLMGSNTNGLKSKKMGSVSYTLQDFGTTLSGLTGMLAMYGFGRKKNGARFHVL